MSNTSPLISIITPVYNSEKYLVHTIESVIAQSYSNWELLLIDDCSTDKSLVIIEKYSALDNRIKSFSNDSNSGQAYTRNRGIEVSNGLYICFLDSDDTWHSDKINEQLSLCIKHDLDFCYTAYSLIDVNNFSLGITFYPSNNISIESLLRCNTIGCLTVMVKREIISSILFLENRIFQGIEDNICWINILKNVPDLKTMPISKVLAYYRITPNSSSSKKISMLEKRVKMLSELFNIKFPKLQIYIFYYILIKGYDRLRLYLLV